MRFGGIPATSLLQRLRLKSQRLGEAPKELWQEFQEWSPKQRGRLAVGLEAMLNAVRRVVAGAMMVLSTAVPLPKWLYTRLERDYFFSPRKVMGVKFKQNPELNKEIQVNAFQMNPRSTELETLHSFYLPAQDGKPTIVFFHGRDTNIGHLDGLFKAAYKKGYGFFAYDYPGFGKSDGLPNEKSLKRSGVAACRFLAGDGYVGGYNVPYQDQILMGYSLGGGVASNVAKKFAKFAEDPRKATTKFNLEKTSNDKYDELDIEQIKPRGLVLVNTFTSIPKLFEEKLKEQGRLVARRLDPERINVQFNSEKAMQRVKNFPVRVFSCRNDSTVPERVAQQLSNAAKENGKFHRFEGEGHGLHSNEIGEIFKTLETEYPDIVKPKPKTTTLQAKD